jgi:WXG100 family type VII secretion target
MGVTHSADPEALESFGKTMKAQMGKVEQLVKDVESPLNSIIWTGPARDQFQDEWNNSFKPALVKLNTALEAAGTDCENRASGVRAVLGIGG